MNEKTRIQIEGMKKQTIGVEVEMNNISREKAAEIAATFFGTGRYGDTHSRKAVDYCVVMVLIKPPNDGNMYLQ